MTETKSSIYERLSKIDVKPYLKKIKTKRGLALDYLSWANAWGLVKAIYPDATYEYKEYDNWVKVGNTMIKAGTLDYRITSVGCEVGAIVTIKGNRYEERLYPMNFANAPILTPNISQINKAQKRCLVKALALAGLGLSVYAGEDLPSNDDETAKRPAKPRTTQGNARQDSLDQAVAKVEVGAGAKNMPFDEKHAEKISDKVLLEYTYDLNGQKHSMSKLVQAFASRNAKIKAQAKEVADTLQGKDAIAFIELSKRAERLGLLA